MFHEISKGLAVLRNWGVSELCDNSILFGTNRQWVGGQDNDTSVWNQMDCWQGKRCFCIFQAWPWPCRVICQLQHGDSRLARKNATNHLSKYYKCFESFVRKDAVEDKKMRIIGLWKWTF